MSVELSRRGWMAALPAAVGLGATALASGTPAGPPPTAGSPFRFGLNTSTLSEGNRLPIAEVVAIAGKAGYEAIEPWLREIEAHKSAGKSVADLKKQIDDAGLSVESAIGFAEWAVDDATRRARGLERMRRDMDLVRAVGGRRIAAPPVGLTESAEADVRKLGERFRAVCELGEAAGVAPEAEVWGFSRTMSRLGEVAAVVIESGHPAGCILPDVYHLHKGGSGIVGLRMLAPSAIHVFHMNDYPADPPRAAISDAARVFPGDGVAPLGPLLRGLRDGGFRVTLSLELFNRDYWRRDPAEVAATGLAKMKAAVAAALA